MYQVKAVRLFTEEELLSLENSQSLRKNLRLLSIPCTKHARYS